MKNLRSIVCSCFLLFGYLVACADAQILRTVVLSETQAPGMDVGVNFSGFGSRPTLNKVGQTAFRGFLTGTEVDSSNNVSVWSEGGALGVTLVAREGNSPPNPTGDEIFTGTFNGLVLNNAGQITFGVGLAGNSVTGSNNYGLWSEGEGAGLALLGRKGDSAPGTSENFSFLGSPVINNAGQSAFFGLLPTGFASNNSGIWSEGAGAGLALVARGGNLAPGIGGGVNFGTFRDPVINGAGQTAFWAFLTGPGVGDNSIWSEGGGAGLALVARQGESAPVTTGSDSFFNFGDPVINNAGQTVFSADLVGSGSGIWSKEGNAGLTLVAVSGNIAPGVTDAAIFSDFGDPVLNSAGRTAFRADLSGAGVNGDNDLGLWSEGAGAGLTLLARTGNQAPDAIAGAVFSDFSNPTLNGAGQLAFRGTLTGTEVNNSNNRGVWAEDRSGVLTLIAREGDEIDVDDGPGTDLRTIASISLSGGTGNEDGRGSEFNDLGQLALMIQFTDNSKGIFVSNLVATISGDFDGDNDVDGADFLTWQRGELLSPLAPEDLADWEANFGTATNALAASSAVVPEPSSCLLLLVGMLTLLSRPTNRN